MFVFMDGDFSTKRSKRASEEVATNSLVTYVQSIILDLSNIFHSLCSRDISFRIFTWLLFRKRGERFFLPTLNGPTHWEGNTWLALSIKP